MHGSNYVDCTRQLMIDEALGRGRALDGLFRMGSWEQRQPAPRDVLRKASLSSEGGSG